VAKDGGIKTNKAMVESALGESLESGGRFCVEAFVRNLVSVSVNVFTCNLFYIGSIFSK
jgi:hypothetical protein